MMRCRKNRHLDLGATVPEHCSGIKRPCQATLSRISKISSAAEPETKNEKKRGKKAGRKLGWDTASVPSRIRTLVFRPTRRSVQSPTSALHQRSVGSVKPWDALQKTTWAKESFDHVWSTYVCGSLLGEFVLLRLHRFVTVIPVFLYVLTNPQKKWKWLIPN